MSAEQVLRTKPMPFTPSSVAGTYCTIIGDYFFTSLVGGCEVIASSIYNNNYRLFRHNKPITIWQHNFTIIPTNSTTDTVPTGTTYTGIIRFKILQILSLVRPLKL
jgi:hypothetical protein